MSTIRLGVLGGGRGGSMMSYCLAAGADKVQLAAVCDKNPEVLEARRKGFEENSVACYDNFDDFINHPMDAVVLANYAHQHAPFAIRCLHKGLHVFSEVLPCQNMKEAVELIEAVERSGKVYAYGENYCYMKGPREMRRLYREGEIGELEYAEGEYIHNCESIWPAITYGEKDHWRNFMFSTFYCTHSLGPIIHITGLRPVSVTGFEALQNERRMRVGCRGEEQNSDAAKFGHGGSDFYCMDEFIKRLQGDKSADIIDVYEAMDMFLPGLFAYRSILSGGRPVEIPDLRKKENREQFRNDTACTDPEAAGDMLLPATSRGTPDIPDEIYQAMREKWEAHKAEELRKRKQAMREAEALSKKAGK